MMGCRRIAKKVFRHMVQQVTPTMMQSCRDMVLALDEVALPALTGETRAEIAVQHLKQAGRREGVELRNSIARAAVEGIVATLREEVDDLAEIGLADDEEI